MAVQIQLRRDTAVNWAAANPVLVQGEIALDLDELGTANRFKIGNGTDHWSDLLYFTVIDYMETDPVFMAWDKSTGIVITVSQISDFPDIPDSTSDLINDSNFITLEDLPEETDPLFTAWDKSTGISISKSQITDYTEPVQSDWNQTVNTELDYIKNKPSIPADLSDLTDTTGIIPDKVSELENDSGFITIGDVPAETDPVFMAWDKDYNDLINKPTIPAAQVNSDWNATGGVAEILNKPTIPAAQIQSAMTDALASGVQGGEEGLKQFAATSAKLAVGGGAELGAVVKGLGATLNAFGETSEKTGQYADWMFNIVNAGVTTIDELNQYLSGVTPTAASMGLAFDKVGGSLAFMTQKGVPTAQAVSKLNALLLEMAKPTAGITEALGAAGVSLEDFHGMIKNDDIVGALGVLQTGFDKTGKSATAMFSSSEAGAAFNVLMGDLDMLNQTLEFVSDTTGSTQYAYEQMAGTVAVQTNQLKASIQALFISFNDMFNKIILFEFENQHIEYKSSEYDINGGFKLKLENLDFSVINENSTKKFVCYIKGTELNNKYFMINNYRNYSDPYGNQRYFTSDYIITTKDPIYGKIVNFFPATDSSSIRIELY